MSVQFGRYAEIEIRNFDAQTKTIISNEFEIEFEYQKSLDQTKEDDSGRIRIFGLTPGTINSLQFEGGEVVFRCGYIQSSVDVLFIAYISRLYYDMNDNTTVTTIECSANLLNYYITTNTSVNKNGQVSILAYLLHITESLGSEQMVFDLVNVPDSNKETVKEYLRTAPIKFAQAGSLETIIAGICNTLDLTYIRELTESGLIVSFVLGNVGLNKILKTVEQGYTKLQMESSDTENRVQFMDTLKADDNSRQLTILNTQTGLITSKTEYKIANAYADQALNENEEETQASVEKRATAASKKAARDAKELKKRINAEARGKDYKTKNQDKKVTTIQVNRRYNRVKALLNPLVKPQSMVALLDKTSNTGTRPELTNSVTESGVSTEAEVEGEYTLYRVRSANYKGNNKNGDWIMELYCEDTDTNVVTPEEVKAQLASLSPEDVEVEADQEDISQFEGD